MAAATLYHPPPPRHHKNAKPPYWFSAGTQAAVHLSLKLDSRSPRLPFTFTIIHSRYLHIFRPPRTATIKPTTIAFATVTTAADHHLTWIPAVTTGCSGSVAECLAEGRDLEIEDDFEFAMDSESTRRILANNRRYISYGALSKNNDPCSRRGASYYNCRRGGQANPYQRGCSSITRCRR